MPKIGRFAVVIFEKNRFLFFQIFPLKKNTDEEQTIQSHFLSRILRVKRPKSDPFPERFMVER